jgi:hypothetical protein
VLESNTGIVAERGLEVFGFQHLSFQEYFVAQSLVKTSSKDRNIVTYYSIDEVANRILLFTINPRFRESLLLALGWISWKWSFDDYNKFCNLLIASNKTYVISLGTFLFFDAYNDLTTLPSQSVIFTALNNLLNHPLNTVTERCLIPYLLKLPENIIKNWMSTYMKDKKSFLKFCQCLLIQFEEFFSKLIYDPEPKLSVLLEQLWSFYNESLLTNFVIDQTFRHMTTFRKAPDYIFKKEPMSYFEQHNIDEHNIHPLILSIIIVVCGGVSVQLHSRNCPSNGQ